MSQSSPPPQRSFVIPETPPLQVSSPLPETPLPQTPINSPPVIVLGTLPTTVQKPTQLVQGAMPSPQRLLFDNGDNGSNGSDNGSNGSDNGSNGSGSGGGSGRRKSTLLLHLFSFQTPILK